MWVFGYGSLMWDGWEVEFGYVRQENATLRGYTRDFNKASVRNWGSPRNPGPTLGLDPSAESECIGRAFEFPESEKKNILRVLGKREGPSFLLEEKQVHLDSGDVVSAFVPVNDHSLNTFIGNRTLDQRASMALVAHGTDGKCVDYIKNIFHKLRDFEIYDQTVERFWSLVSDQLAAGQLSGDEPG